MRLRAFLPIMALLAMAAAPRGSFVTATPMPDFTPPPQTPVQGTTRTTPGYDTAPTPNQDAFAPTARASRDSSFAPGLFSRRDQYRGEGLSPASSAQTEQERRVKPGAGIKLSVPLQ